MADYSIKLGVVLDTKNIDTAINKYQGKPIEVKSKLDTTGIKNQIANYKAKPIEVNVKLNTTGIAKKIGQLKIKTPVKVDAKLNTQSINTAIKNYKAKPIKVSVQLNHSEINKQIKNYKATASIKLNTKLDNNEISKQIKSYQARTPIKLRVKLTKNDIDAVLKGYDAKPIKLNAKLNKGAINEEIKAFVPKSTIKLKAALQKGVIAKEINDYRPSTPIKVDLALDYADIDKKVGAYAAKGGISIPARLVPAARGFDTQITKTPVAIQGKLEPDSINAIINKFKPTSKIKVDVKLEPKDINAQMSKLPKPSQPISVGVKLDESNVNAAIALFKPVATLGVKPDLILEDVDEQIMAYIPKAKIKVNVDLDDADADVYSKTKGKNTQNPITVSVKLNREKLNEEIRNFKTNSKIKVGIKLDSKGLAEQIKKMQPKTKIKVGVQIDPQDVAQQVGNVDIGTPIKLGVELDEDGIWAQIDKIKNKLQELGNIRIDIGDDIQNEVSKKTSGTYNTASNGSYASNIAQEFKEVDIVLKSTKNQMANLGKALRDVGFNNSAIKTITGDFKELGVTVTNVTSRLNKDGSVKLTVKGLDQFKDVVTYVNNVDTKGSLGSWSETISRDVNNVAENFNKLKSLAKDIGNLKIDIFKSDDVNEVKQMTEKLNQFQKEYNELFASTQGGLKSNQLNQLDNIAKKSEESLNRLQKEYAETRAELAKEIRGNFSGYEAQIKSLENDIDKLSKKAPEVERGVKNVRQALDQMYNAGNDNSLIEAEERYQKELKETLAQLQINQAAEESSYYDDTFNTKKEAALARLNGLFEVGSQASREFGAEAQKLHKELNQVGNVKGIDNVTRKISNLEKKIKDSNLQTKTLGTRLKEQFSKYSNYLSIASVFMYATQAARSMFEQVKLIDSAMTELKKVTNETDASYNKFLTNAATRSREIGTTIDGLVSSTADFARLGYGFEDAQGLAEVANIYAVVGDEVEGVEGATKSLISTIAAFKDEMNGMGNADFAMSIIDIFNELGNNFAISSGGLGEALERSASSLAAANNSLHESAALITAANTVVQNPEKVGTAMKTISMRIRGAKTE